MKSKRGRSRGERSGRRAWAESRSPASVAAALLVLAAGAFAAPAHAQTKPNPVVSDRNPSAKPTSESRYHREPAPATPDEPPTKWNRWYVRLGYIGVFYHSSASIAPNGQVLPGATAKTSNNATVIFDIGYDITKDFSAQLFSGVPPKPHITGEGTVASLGILGKVRYGPIILSGIYRLPKTGNFRPYLGAGVAYAIIFKEFDAAVSRLKVHNNWGVIVQAGGEYQLTKRWDLFVDFKEMWLSVNAKGFLSGNIPVQARVKLDPTLISAGVKFRFR